MATSVTSETTDIQHFKKLSNFIGRVKQKNKTVHKNTMIIAEKLLDKNIGVDEVVNQWLGQLLRTPKIVEIFQACNIEFNYFGRNREIVIGELSLLTATMQVIERLHKQPGFTAADGWKLKIWSRVLTLTNQKKEVYICTIIFTGK